MIKLIPYLIGLLLSALNKSVVFHSDKSNVHQRAANYHQANAEQSAKLLKAFNDIGLSA